MRLGRWITLMAIAMMALPAIAETNAELRDQVWKAETAFAKTMADRPQKTRGPGFCRGRA